VFRISARTLLALPVCRSASSRRLGLPRRDRHGPAGSFGSARRRATVWAGLGFLSAAFAAQATAQARVTWPTDIPRQCGRIEFVLRTATLSIEPRWLATKTLIDLFNWVSGSSCPTWPTSFAWIEIGAGARDAIDVPDGLGSEEFLIKLSGLPENALSDDAAAAGGARQPLGKPTIEDVSRGKLRVYRLRYPKSSAAAAAPVEIACRGIRYRECSTEHDYAVDRISVTYKVSVDPGLARDISPEVSNDPTTEPGVLAQFDQNLRIWVETLRKNR
jgi:hypothetical protein